MIISYKFTLMLSALMIVSDVQHGYQVTAAGESCGVPAIPPLTEPANIIGGVKARPHSWPWQCLIMYKDDHLTTLCGCVVLTSEWLVSAAHCEFDVTLNVKVTAGAHEQRLVDELVPLKVEKVVVHQQYQHETKDFDIMLIKLAKPINFTANISPVCLPTEDVPVGSSCIVTGWGDTSSDYPSSSDVLMQVSVPIISNSQCKEWYEKDKPVRLKNSIITDTMICAAREEGGVDSCAGDSGGPLVCRSASDGVWRLHGIVSHGNKCAEPQSPGVYVRVTMFVDWINRTMHNLPTPPKYSTFPNHSTGAAHPTVIGRATTIPLVGLIQLLTRIDL